MPRERIQNPTLRQTSRGSWFIRVWVDVLTKDGIERRKKIIPLGPAELGKRGAELARRRAMETINRASYVVQAQIRFGDLLTEYKARHYKQVGSAAQKKYESLIRTHIEPAFGGLQLCEVTAKRVQDWIDAKAEAGKSWNTRSDLRQLMSGIFTCAIAWGYWQEGNPIGHVSPGRKRLAREKNKLTDDQTRRLLAELPPQVRTMACVALFCTLRISEVLGLQEKHIDFDAGTIRVAQRFHRGDLDVTKNRQAERVVPMGHLAEDLKLLCLGDPERFVFQIETRPGRPGPHQKRFICRDDRGLQRIFLRPAAKAVGCYTVGFGWHALRREAITAFNASLGVTQAMKLGGHSSVEMSAEYTLADRELQDAAVRERQEKLLGEVSGKPS